MSRHAISLERPDGSIFASNSEPVVERMPPLPDCLPNGYTGEYDDKHGFAFMNGLWQRTVNARQPEIARLTMLERYYRGLHYKSDMDNRRMEVTNLCFSNVEVTRAVMMSRPVRAQVRARYPMDESKIRVVREAGKWWQDQAAISAVRYDSTGTMLKYGYSILLMVVDPLTGMPYLINWSPFDFYPDGAARDVQGCEYFFFAGPVATRRLRSMFPKHAESIVPDNYTSPSYDSMVVPDQTLYAEWYGRGSNRVPYMTAPESNTPGNPPTSGTTTMTPSNSTTQADGSDTSFLVQLLIRDRSLRKMVAMGQTTIQHPELGPISFPDHHEQDVPVCPSGWRLMWAVSGKLVHEEPLDECFGSVPFRITYRYKHDHRIAGVGEQDNLIPLNRSINERKNVLNRASQFTGLPAFQVDKGGADVDSGVNPGDVIERKAGTKGVERLETAQPTTQEFEHVRSEFRDAEVVTGVNEALHGIHPVGIEAGVALRALQGAAAVRIQAAMRQSAAVWAELTTMACRVMGKKLNHAVFYQATDGQPAVFRAVDLQGEYEFYISDEMSDLEAEEKKKEDVLGLYQLGLLDPGSTLELLDFPNWKMIAARTMQWQLLQKQAEASARVEAEQKSGGGKKPPGDGGGG